MEVAILEADDVHEDEAARLLAEAMQTGELELALSAGGRVNLRAIADGLLEVNGDRLYDFNMLPGFELATRRHHLVVGPNQATDNVASLKIVPYAIHRADLLVTLDLLETATSPLLRYRYKYLAGDPSALHRPEQPYRVHLHRQAENARSRRSRVHR